MQAQNAIVACPEDTMKATVALVVMWCLLVASRPAAAQEPIESRPIVSEVGLIAASDGARLRLRGWGKAQKPALGGGIPNWKVLVLGAAAIVVAVLAVRATSGNNRNGVQ